MALSMRTNTAKHTELYRQFYAAIHAQGLPVNAWCRAHNFNSGSIFKVLTGEWNGPKAKIFLAKVLNAAGVDLPEELRQQMDQAHECIRCADMERQLRAAQRKVQQCEEAYLLIDRARKDMLISSTDEENFLKDLARISLKAVHQYLEVVGKPMRAFRIGFLNGVSAQQQGEIPTKRDQQEMHKHPDQYLSGFVAGASIFKKVREFAEAR